MRVAIVANTSWYLLNFRLNLIRALVEAGHEVVAVAPQDEYTARLQGAGVTCVSVQISGSGVNPLAELRSIMTLWRLFRAWRIDVVLSYTPKGNIYAALAAISRGIPFVPNVSGLGRAFIRRTPVTLVAQLLYRTTFRRAPRVFFQNEDDLEIFVSQGLARRDRCKRLPGSGVDLERFLPEPSVSRHPEEPIFLLIARLMWDKGVGEYVEAARTVIARYPRVKFRLLGFVGVDNPSAISQEQIKAWEDEGSIEYLGPTDDVRPHVRDADCVVLPSYREGVPRTLLEAAAMARPVITTDAPGCRDTIIDGETGFLCRPRDSADLAEKILRFIELAPTERALLGEKGRRYVQTNFDERVVIAQYLQLVDSIRSAKESAIAR